MWGMRGFSELRGPSLSEKLLAELSPWRLIDSRRSFLAGVFLSLAAPAHGAALRVDFNRVDAGGAFENGSATEAGFQAFDLQHETSGQPLDVRRAETFPADFGEVTVEIDINSENSAAYQAISRTAQIDRYDGALPDLVRDWTGLDARATDGSPSSARRFTLTFRGLPAGVYELTSYHHDPQDQTGSFAVWVNDVPVIPDGDIADISNNPGPGNPPHHVVFRFETSGDEPTG